MINKVLFFLFFSISVFSQNLNVNNDYYFNKIKSSILTGEIKSELSLNIRPLNSNNFKSLFINNKNIIADSKKKFEVKNLGVDYFIEYNSHHPYNRNNGTMIPNRGYQHIISPGIFFKYGPLTIQFKPEHHYSENKNFDGFWEGHYPVIWAKRYKLWNRIDMPERHGKIRHNRTTLGQSSIRLNWKKLSFGISNENLWWGPAQRNSIMMSNHAQGFKHITFNSTKPINTKIGNFEWQLVSGILQSSGYLPTGSDYTYAGTNIYVPKINQKKETDDTRYIQALIVSYSPKWIRNLSFGFIRWAQMYSALVEGRYTWMKGTPSYFPVFSGIFRRNQSNVDYEKQTNEAGGLFMKWFWEDSKAEIYAEYHLNDSKYNLRDLILDPDHSRAATIGIQKVFNIKNSNYLFSWEWTQMEQTGSRLIRNSTSWYEHQYVFDGYTNKGEVLGSSIGPGSNSHYLSISRINKNEKIGFAVELIDVDNDFYHEAFASARDYRRYWKDISLHFNFNKEFDHFILSSNIAFIRSLNYQWELDDYSTPYYHPGRDVNNLFASLKFTYFGNF